MIRNAALLIVSVLCSAAIGELALQKIPFTWDWPTYSRYLYYSENPWIRKSIGTDWIVLNPPSARIRTFARYQDANDYDYVYHTDREGFRTTDCAVSGGRQIVAVIGDSYTEGSGGDNWLNTANDSLKARGSKYCYLNAGVAGTGFLHWISLIPHIERLFDPPFHVIIFITQDLPRRKWYAQIKEHQLYYCFDDTDSGLNKSSECNNPTAIYTSEEHATFHSENYRKSPVRRWFPATSTLISKVSMPWGEADADDIHSKQEEQLAAFLDSIEKASAKPVLVIRVISKPDLASGYYPFSKVTDRGKLTYREVDCHLSMGDFHRNDGHPHNEGYKKIAACVSEEIIEFERALIAN